MKSLFISRARLPHLAALLLVTGTSALATDAYIAALPTMQRSLHTSSSVAQLTMTGFIAGMAVGQLSSGPVSDARGRRRLIVAACLLYTVMSALCALSTSGWLLVVERAVQGMAAGASVTVGRAVVTDSQTGRRAAATFGTLSSVALIAPVIAPAIGGALLAVGDWRTIFWFLAAVGVAMTVAAVVGLPETLPAERRHPGGPVQFGRRVRSLLADPRFVSPVIVQCLTIGGFFVYIGGSSFVLQDGLGVSRSTYTLIFSVDAVAMVVSSAVFRLLVTRVSVLLLRRCAVTVQTGAVTGLFAIVVTDPGHRPPVPVAWVALALMTAGLGMYLPANSVIAQAAGRRLPGTASALGGGLPFLVGALTTPLTGALGSQTVLTMSICMVVPFALAAVAAIVLRRWAVEPTTADAPAPVEPDRFLAGIAYDAPDNFDLNQVRISLSYGILK